MKKTGSVINVLCFSLFIAVFAALLVFSPDKEMSVEENRRLARLPSFSFSELFSGRFTRDFESWIAPELGRIEEELKAKLLEFTKPAE